MPHTYLPPEPPCTHPRKGTVRAGDTTTTVCDRSACIAATMRWAAVLTGTIAQHAVDTRDLGSIGTPAAVAACLRCEPAENLRRHALDELIDAFGFDQALRTWSAGRRLAQVAA